MGEKEKIVQRDQGSGGKYSEGFILFETGLSPENVDEKKDEYRTEMF